MYDDKVQTINGHQTKTFIIIHEKEIIIIYRHLFILKDDYILFYREIGISMDNIAVYIKLLDYVLIFKEREILRKSYCCFCRQ